MATVIYDGKAIIPAPLININKIYRTAGDGSKHGVGYDLTLTGTLMPFRGSPSGNYPLGDPSNAFWTSGGTPPDETYVGGDTPFVQLQRKQEAIRWLFREDGKQLEWYGGAASPAKCRPKVIDINFSEGQWVDRSDFTISFQAESIVGITDEDAFEASGLQSVSETWDFDEVPGQIGAVYSITHNITAKGELTFDVITGTNIQGWVNAQTWCDARVAGVPDTAFVEFATDFTDWVNGDYTKSTSIAEKDGNYSITETWLIREAGPGETAATWTERAYTIITRLSDDSVEVGYDGTIHGIEEQERTGGASALSNAKAAIPTNSQAKADTEAALGTLLGDFVIPSSPSQTDIAINEKDGIVTFAYNWSAGEDVDFTQGNEATLSYNTGDGIYTIALTVDIVGAGDTKTERLDNARSNIPTDSDARALAISIIGSQIPAGVTFTGDHKSKANALSETRGSSTTSWTWTDKDPNNVDISVETTFPQTIAAEISIPGRTAGPIIQRINAATSRKITVTYTSEGHSSQPDSNVVATTMDTAGGIPLIDQFLVGSYILDNDRETWNSGTGKYSRTRTHTVTES
jgi:hypothetical protein